MCTVFIGFQAFPHIPLIVAANRDEFYARPAAPPQRSAADPWVVAGRDLSAGGTWLGMNAWGIVGLTNQPSKVLDRASRSRGLLVLDALEAGTPDAALRVVRQHALEPSQPYNLFIAAPDQVHVAYRRDDGLRLEALEPGWHVLPNGHADDRTIPKVGRALDLLQALPAEAEPAVLAEALRTRLADHQLELSAPDEPEWLPEELRRAVSAICVHSPFYGTRSYSILMIERLGGRYYWHGEGAPCTVGFQEVGL